MGRRAPPETLALAGGIDWLGDLARASRPRHPVNFPDILFEDDFLVAFDKPSGLAVVPERRGGAAASLMGLVRGRYGESIANVHRLDPETSGVVLCAKTKASLDFLSGQFQSKTVRKTHSALVALLPADRAAPAGGSVLDPAGSLPAEFTMDLAIGADEVDPARMRVFRRRGGQPSATEFRVLESFGRFAWLECRPLTGRTHQVRVHLAAAGAPVLNDRLYGDPSAVLLLSGLKRRYKGREAEKPLISRLALHAGNLGFVHPASREPMEITAALPREFEVALKYLRKFPPSRTRS
jgi:23S rRNA pseudouridine1911/1915/1917 synthase